MLVPRQRGLPETIDSVSSPVTRELTIKDRTETKQAKHTEKMPTNNRELATRQSVVCCLIR
jgi:hypothetical protein